MGAKCVGTKPQEFCRNWSGTQIYGPIDGPINIDGPLMVPVDPLYVLKFCIS